MHPPPLSLKSALKDMFGAAFFVTTIRLFAIFSGSWLGCYATSTQLDYRKNFWMTMITQAGVAMGLARLAGTRFPDWGPAFQTFMVRGITATSAGDEEGKAIITMLVGLVKRHAASLSCTYDKFFSSTKYHSYSWTLSQLETMIQGIILRSSK